ncbi:MAG: hypothetical protein JSS24_05595 [Proteobacteria bacterium]|nr:hypothetical protein [Pseudomonadota bacterium]
MELEFWSFDHAAVDDARPLFNRREWSNFLQRLARAALHAPADAQEPDTAHETSGLFPDAEAELRERWNGRER